MTKILPAGDHQKRGDFLSRRLCRPRLLDQIDEAPLKREEEVP